MKFLLVLTVLATTSVFAQPGGGRGGDKIKCYESAQQNGHRRPAFVFEVEDRDDLNREIKLVFPEYIKLRQDDGCLKDEGGHGGPTPSNGKDFEACLGEGQEIGRLVPVEIEFEHEEDTFYCDNEIKRYLRDEHK